MTDLTSDTLTPPTKLPVHAYWELCKPRVVSLMLFTAFVGMVLATTPPFPWTTMILALVGIGLCGGAAATLNHLIDRHIDPLMKRTKDRPLPSGAVKTTQALTFSGILSSFGTAILWFGVNPLTTVLTLCTLLGYGIVYTVFLKRATPQNIVIGGLAGALPPLLGWTAVTNRIDANPLLLVLIIFIWTPPHFWALALDRYEDYAKTKIPMLPITHGKKFTTLSILLYTVLLIPVSLLPTLTGFAGPFYGFAALFLGLGFLFSAYQLFRYNKAPYYMKTFRYSILYLTLLFFFLLLEHFIA